MNILSRVDNKAQLPDHPRAAPRVFHGESKTQPILLTSHPPLGPGYFAELEGTWTPRVGFKTPADKLPRRRLLFTEAHACRTGGETALYARSRPGNPLLIRNRALASERHRFLSPCLGPQQNS